MYGSTSLLITSIFLLTGCTGGQTSNAVEGQEGTKNTDSSEKVYELTVNNYYGSNDPWVYGVYEPWKQYVDEKTNGRIEVHISHGSTLGAADAALKDIQGGVYDLSYVAPSLHADTELYPLTIGTLPFAFPNAEVGTRVMEKFAQKYGEFNDYVHIGMITSDPYLLFSRDPVNSVDDIKNKKYRITGKNDAILYEAWGVTPVSVPIADVYESIQKTTIDGLFFSPIGGMGSKFYEVAPNLLDLPFMVQPLSFGLNQVFYEQLPEDLKNLMDEDLGPKLVELFVQTYTGEVENAKNEINKLTEGKGGITTLSPEEEQKFTAPAKDSWEFWVKEANEKGYPGDQMMADFKELLKEEGIEVPY